MTLSLRMRPRKVMLYRKAPMHYACGTVFTRIKHVYVSVHQMSRYADAWMVYWTARHRCQGRIQDFPRGRRPVMNWCLNAIEWYIFNGESRPRCGRPPQRPPPGSAPGCTRRSICAHDSRPNSRKAEAVNSYVTMQLSLKLTWAAMHTADSPFQIIHIAAHVKFFDGYTHA